METLKSERLFLEKLNVLRDLDAYSDIMGEEEVGKWLPKQRGYTREEVERFVDYIQEHWEARGYGIWGVFELESGKLVGHCGLNYVKDLDQIEILYAFGKDGRGRGYGVESARLVFDYAFHHLQLPSLIALSRPHNQKSQRVMETIGLTYKKDVFLWNSELVYYSIDA